MNSRTVRNLTAAAILPLALAQTLGCSGSAAQSTTGTDDEAVKSNAAAVTVAPVVDAAVSATPSAPPAGYVLVPGGYVHPSCVHEIPNHGTMKGGEVFDENGALVATNEKCAYPSALQRPTGPTDRGGKGILPTVNGWAEWTGQTLPPGATTWNNYISAITVPPPPSIQNSQTLFYFGGVEPNSLDEILQPVLQWGPSQAGGGKYWTFASWLVGNWTGYSTLMTTSPGHILDTWLTLKSAYWDCEQPYGCNAQCGTTYVWEVGVQDESTYATSIGTFVLGPYPPSAPPRCGMPSELYPLMFPAVLEEYNTNLCQNPQFVRFTGIYLAADQNQSSVTSAVWQSPNFWQNRTSQNPPSCFYGATVNANNVTLW